jgi:hypothetical protein
MNAPIKPRYAYVDDQINRLEEDIRRAIMSIEEIAYWEEVGEISPRDVTIMNTGIYEAFRPLMVAYESSKEVSELIERAIILIQNCAWCAMNLPFINMPNVHVDMVCENVMRVFNRMIYSSLRTEMIMANHHCEVIQRIWRRCITDPAHPACQRRLEFDCAEFSRDLMSLKSNSV